MCAARLASSETNTEKQGAFILIGKPGRKGIPFEIKEIKQSDKLPISSELLGSREVLISAKRPIAVLPKTV